MPVYNGAEFIDEAIASVLTQSCRDFTLYILNDGSKDSTADKIEYWQEKDNRIHVTHQANQGISVSLNRLIQMSDSPFLIRMDADDIAYNTRIESQLNAMHSDSECGIVGSKVRLIGSGNGTWHFRQTNEQTKALALLGNTCLCHPTWMMRREKIDNLTYSSEFPHMEDMFFLAEYIAKPNSKLYALDDILLDYRVHSSSTSVLHHLKQLEQRAKILEWIWQKHELEFCKMDPVKFLTALYASQEKLLQVDITIIKELVSRICPQLIRINPSVRPEMIRRLGAIDESLTLDM